MTVPILSTIAPLILIGAGIILIAIEALIYSFIFIWFGISLIIIGIVSFYYMFDNGIWQLASASLIAIMLLLTLRTTLMSKFLKSKDNAPKEDFLNAAGKGMIQNGKVYYKATYWDIDSDLNETFQEDEQIEVVSASKGVAKIKKLQI